MKHRIMLSSSIDDPIAQLELEDFTYRYKRILRRIVSFISDTETPDPVSTAIQALWSYKHEGYNKDLIANALRYH